MHLLPLALTLNRRVPIGFQSGYAADAAAHFTSRRVAARLVPHALAVLHEDIADHQRWGMIAGDELAWMLEQRQQ